MEHNVALPTYYETSADKSVVSDWTCPEFKVSGAFSSQTSRSEVTVKIPEGADISCVGYAFSIRVSRDSADLYNGNNLPCPAFLIKVN